jgi:hypothetical protein
MLFGDVECAHKFYKTYAHDTRFSIRTRQQRCDENGVVKWKRFLCSREGYKTSIRSKYNESSTKVCKTRESRCGCEAYIYVKRTNEGKYEIAALYEGHNHEFVTPSKRHLRRSNRHVNEKAKTTLFNYHKASIGTSQAYRLLQVGAWGFQYVGCTKKDMQNYYTDFRNKIKDAYAQMFVDNLGMLKQLDPSFFFEYEVNDGRLV